jgi:8-oxo-dGTP diphosphatase
MESKYAGGKLKREPQEFQELGWFDWNNLPEPLFLPLQNLLKTGFKPGERK